MSTPVPSGYKLERTWSLTHFLIGIFGAAAIIGVMAKIFNFEAEIFGVLVTWKPVVLVGFVGEAIVFILMGMMREMRYVPVGEDEAEKQEPALSAGGIGEGAAALDEAGEKLTGEARALAQELQSVRAALARQEQVYEELSTLHSVLQRASSGLSEHVGALEDNMEALQETYAEEAPIASELLEIRGELANSSKELRAEMEEARSAVTSMQEEVSATAQRFAEFNRPSDSNGRTA